MKDNQGFIEEVVKDARSFHVENFEKVVSLVEVWNKL